MKSLIIVAVIISASYALSQHYIEEARKKVHQIDQECIHDTGVSSDEVVNIKELHGPSSHEGKCFVACFGKHIGLMDENGKLDKDSGLTHLEPIKSEDEDLYNKAHEVLEKCYDEVHDESDYCETAAKFGSCLKLNAKEAGIVDMIYH